MNYYGVSIVHFEKVNAGWWRPFENAKMLSVYIPINITQTALK